MKYIVLLLAIVATSGQAQTFVNYKITSFPSVSGKYTGTNIIIVPTNTLARVLNFQVAGSVTNVICTMQYTGQPLVNFSDVSQVQNVPVLGPATIFITAQAATGSGNFTGWLVQFDTVNTTPSLTGYGVQPNGHSATVLLQSSTNLTAWITTTNGTYGMTNQAQFYRLSMTVN